MNGESDDTGTRARRLQLAGNFQPGKIRHVEIQENDIRLQYQGSSQSFLSIPGLSDDLQILLEIEHSLDPLPEQGVIIRNQNLNRHTLSLSFPNQTFPLSH